MNYHTKDISKYKFLITGGAGFIGSNIVKYLLENNACHVRIIDNLSNGYSENIKPFYRFTNFEFIEGDIRDYDICKKSMIGIDFVSHQAALGSVPRSIKDPILTNSVNVSGFLNILNAAHQNGKIKKMVYAASSSTYGDSPHLPKKENIIGSPLSPYAVTKLVNELYGDVYSRVFNFNTIGLRYFNVFGPNQNPENPYAAVIPKFIKSAKNNQSPIIYGDGSTTRDFTYVDNVVQANIKALLNSDHLKNHEIVNIACGRQTSLNHLWELVCKIYNKKLNIIYENQRSGDINHSLADIAKAKELLNYEPTIHLLQGLEKTIHND